jgi:acyl dehydratase
MIGISVCLNSNAGAAVVVVDDEAATAGFTTARADGAFVTAVFAGVVTEAGGGTTSVALLQSSIKAKHYY